MKNKIDFGIINKRTILVSLLGFIMGRGVFFSMNPIGIGYFLCVYCQDTNRGMLTAALLLGMMTRLDGVSVIKYGLIMLALSVVERLMNGYHKISSKQYIWPAIGGGITGALSVTKAFLYSNVMEHIALALLEGILVYIACYLLQKGTAYILYRKKGEPMNNEEMISIGIIVAIAIYSVPSIGLLSFSLSQAAAFLLVACMGYKYGSGLGAVAGAACGIVISYSSNSVTFIGVLCILGICGGMFQEIGKLGAGIAYVTTGISLGYLYERSLIKIQGLEALILGVAIFFMIPAKWLEPVCWEKKKEKDYVKQNMQVMTKRKFRDFSDSLQKLSKSFVNYTERKQILGCDDMNGIFEEISGKFCKECSRCERCWNDNYEATYGYAQDMFAIAKKNGKLKLKDVPIAFQRQCVYADSFIKETNKSLEIATLNMRWYNKLMESRQAVAGQLEEMAEIVKDFASEITEMKEVKNSLEEQMIARLKQHHIEVSTLVLMENKNGRLELHILARTKRGRCITTREMAVILGQVLSKKLKPSEQTKNIVPKEFEPLVFLEDTRYKVLTGVARAAKKGEEVSGDNFSFLELDSGEIIMTLCDGMGSGEDAHEESKSVIDLIEDFMEAGFKEAKALHLINSLYALKADGQSFSTVDMGIIDLFTGKCSFVKMGAVATFLKKKSGVEAVMASSLPAGIFGNTQPEGIYRRIRDGEFIIMLTDGALDCFPGEEKEEYLKILLEENKSNNPREIANYILEKAMEASNLEVTDDMTVIVAGVWEKC